MRYQIPISVVMPCHNYGRYVSAAIDSILEQSFRNFELIIVNDGSTDDSHKKITRYTDERIRYIHLRQNKGNYVARNLGMDMARGKYICVMDADDIAHTDRLKIQFEYMEKHPRVGITGGHAMRLNEDGTRTTTRFSSPVVSNSRLRVLLLMNSMVIHPTAMIRKRLLKKHQLRYCETKCYAADYEFFARSAALFTVKNLDEVLLHYRIHDAQISIEKREQQRIYADTIRLDQLKQLGVFLSQKEEELYLNLVKRNHIPTEADLEAGVAVLNRLLENNFKEKVFRQHILYELFNYLISVSREQLL